MIKKVVLDKADRVYHFPFDLEEFFPRRAFESGEKRLPTIDLGRFNWPIRDFPEESAGGGFSLAAEARVAELAVELAAWLDREHGVVVDPEKEMYIGHGIFRILFDLCLAFVEYGDIVLCPEPGVPAYRRYVIAAGGVPVSYSISERTGGKPSLSRLPANLGKAAKIMVLNNPHNPFGTMMDETELTELVRMASRQNIFIVNDAAYNSLAEEKFRLLRSVPGGRKVSLEIFSVPYTFGLPYIPLGFAVGPPELISGLKMMGRTVGMSVPEGWLDPVMAAIEAYPGAALQETAKFLARSRLAAEQMAEGNSWVRVGGKSSPFIWVRIPERRHSATYATTLLRRKRLLVLPGIAFGETGEGYLRLSLTASAEDYAEAAERLARKLKVRTGE